MRKSEPAEVGSAGARTLRWGAAVLAALVLSLFILSYTNSRSGSAHEQSDSARFGLENLLLARQVYLALHTTTGGSSALDAQKVRLLAGLEEAAAADPSPASIRRLALGYYMVGDARWRDSIQRLTTVPMPHSAAEVERETALWGAVLGGAPTREQLAEFEKRVRDMGLGWYAHVALESAYSRAGLDAEAREQARLANRSSARVFVLGLLGVIAGVLGLGICLMIGARVVASARAYRPPLTPIDRLLTPRAPWPFVPAQRTLLYYLFLAYLASMALLRYTVASAGLTPQLTRLAHSGPVPAVLLSLLLSLLPLALPITLYLVYGKRAFITPQALGFCTASWKTDLLCGMAGYLAGIPLLFIARTLSESLFRGVETPINPAISAFAGSDNTLFQVLIFVQAALLAPLIEETLFRGIFFQSLEARLGVWQSALLSSSIFALLHPQLPLGFLGIFVLGMIFNWLFVLRRSLLPAIFAHAINNGLILFFLLSLVRG